MNSPLCRDTSGRCASCQREVEWLRELHAACIAGEADLDSSAALRKLRRRLEDPPRGPGPMARLRDLLGPQPTLVPLGDRH